VFKGGTQNMNSKMCIHCIPIRHYDVGVGILSAVNCFCMVLLEFYQPVCIVQTDTFVFVPAVHT